MTGSALMDVCDGCARRSWLVARLAGHLEKRRGERDTVREVLGLSDARLIEALGGLLAGEIAAEHAAMDPAELRACWTAAGSHAMCRHAAGYPLRLLELPDAPAVLHLRGEPERIAALLAAPLVAIVGARKASDEGRETARSLGRGLSAAGVTVVSGMALGIDAAAHDGAVDAGANSLAVLACGPEIAYPRSRRALHGRLVGTGGVLSELPPGTPPFKWAFPARNRIIAALAELVILVEAAERSGSLITADIAIGLGRDVGAVPGSPLSWRCSGTNQLLRDGATVIRDAVDALDGITGLAVGVASLAGPTGPRPAPTGLEPRLLRLLEAVEHGSEAVDDLAADAAEVRTVLGDLTELELLGLVRRGPGGRYTRVSR